MKLSWEGFVSNKWNPDELRAEREAWEKKFLPALRERDKLQAEARSKCIAAWATLNDNQKEALEPFMPGFIGRDAGGAA